jgi:hypothetical protein
MDWNVTLDVRGRYGRVKFAGSALRMWCYTEDAIPTTQAPRIMLSDSDQHGTPAISLFNAKNVPPAGNEYIGTSVQFVRWDHERHAARHVRSTETGAHRRLRRLHMRFPPAFITLVGPASLIPRCGIARAGAEARKGTTTRMETCITATNSTLAWRTAANFLYALLIYGV